MSELNLGYRMSNLEMSPEFKPYTGVRIRTGVFEEDDIELVYESGNDTGRVLELVNEWGTQEQADKILQSIQGLKYKPIMATNADIGADTSVGDSITANGIPSAVAKRTVNFGSLMDADVEAPQDEEVEYEYTYKDPEELKYRRLTDDFKSSLRLQATEIAARVEKTNGDKNSFGWKLESDNWSLYSGNDLVLRCDKDGLYVVGDGDFTGTVYATEGSFSGTINATSGEFRGVVYANAFYDKNGRQLQSLSDVRAVLGDHMANMCGYGTSFANMDENGTNVSLVAGEIGSFSKTTVSSTLKCTGTMYLNKSAGEDDYSEVQFMENVTVITSFSAYPSYTQVGGYSLPTSISQNYGTTTISYYGR